MVKTAILTSEYAEVQKAFERGDKQYYYLNLLPKEDGDMTICLQSLLDHEPTEEDKETTLLDYANVCKTALIKNIELYDNSENVNSFILNETKAWLDKATRVGLANSLSIEKSAGKTETTLFLNGSSITCSIDKAQEILSTLELYALDCYRQTEKHKSIISSTSDPAILEAYDYTTGYPKHPEFTI